MFSEAVSLLSVNEKWLATAPGAEVLSDTRWKLIVRAIAAGCVAIRSTASAANADAIERWFRDLSDALKHDAGGKTGLKAQLARGTALDALIGTIGCLASRETPPQESPNWPDDLYIILGAMNSQRGAVQGTSLIGRHGLPGKTKLYELLSQAERATPPLVERDRGQRSGYRLTIAGRTALEAWKGRARE